MYSKAALDILSSPLGGDAQCEVRLDAASQLRARWLKAALTTGFYKGGYSSVLELYNAIVEQAAVHGIWVRSGSPWQVKVVGAPSLEMMQELVDRRQADIVAARLADSKPVHRYGEYFLHRASLGDRSSSLARANGLVCSLPANRPLSLRRGNRRPRRQLFQ